MARDEQIHKRNALVLPGGLLLFYSFIAIIYAEALRPDSDFCPDGSWVLINSVCYTVWKLVLPIMLVGAGLVVGGLVGMRGEPERLEQRLYHGTGSHFLLALLISLVVVPVLALLIQLIRQRSLDTVFVVDFYDVAFKHTFLLTIAILLGLMMLLPYLIGYVGTIMRRDDFLRAAQALAEGEEEEPIEEEIEEEEEPQWPASRAQEGEWAPVAEAAPADEESTWQPIEEPVEEPVEEQVEEELVEVVEEPDEIPPAELAWEDDVEPEGAPFYYGYKGGEMDVEELEGIGPKYAAKLKELGVHTTARLRAEDTDTLADRLGVSENHVTNWQRMAELVAVKGVGPQYAEVMVRAGIEGIPELKRRSAARMAKQINDYLETLDVNVLGNAITEARVLSWQEEAKGMRKVRMDVPEY